MPSPWTATELGALLVAAGLGPPVGHALISLLALNGLRVSEGYGCRHRASGTGTRAPEHLRTVTPRLVVSDGAAAIAFYARAFGAGQIGDRFTGPDGELIHAEIRIGDSVVMITEAAGTARRRILRAPRPSCRAAWCSCSRSAPTPAAHRCLPS